MLSLIHIFTECEPARAAKFGMDHYTWLCINPKEAQDVAFARDVICLLYTSRCV